jgi:hypothetical protein
MVQEVTTRSWISRIINALFGVLIGLVLIIGAFVLVFSNEHKGLQMAESLHQVESMLIPVTIAPVQPSNQLKVIYFTGEATTKDILKDSQLGIELNAIKLERHVEMYQWRENVETHTEKQVGGSEQEVKTYTYESIWSPNIINSTDFKDGIGHQNPRTMLITAKYQQAKKVKVGDFILSPDLVAKMNGAEPVNLEGIKVDKLQKKYRHPVHLLNDELFMGLDPANPQVGDLRIKVTAVLPQQISVIAQQNKNTIQPYLAPAGKEIALLVDGVQSPAAMIKHAQSENRTLTWVWRLAALIMFMVGVALILNPLTVLSDLIPFIGTLIGFGVALVSIMLGLLLWAVAVAIAWVFVRPLLALGLLSIVLLFCVGLFVWKKWVMK